MKSEICVCGNNWTEVFNTLLYSDCYFCTHCNKLYAPSVREVTKEEIDERFNSDRFNAIKTFAQIKEAKKKITKEDLIKLGYID